jgi:hypothetical protein
MNSKILALAATVLTATTALASAAEANGVRLGFGFPLGSFVAHPAGSSYNHNVYQQSAPHRSSVAQEKAPAAKRVVHKAKSTDSKSDDVASNSSSETGTTGSTALIATANAPAATETAPAPEAKAETPATDASTTTVATATPAATPAAAPAATETAPVETKAEEPKQEDASSKVSSLKKLTCKKFIPAIGLTVTVGCND